MKKWIIFFSLVLAAGLFLSIRSAQAAAQAVLAQQTLQSTTAPAQLPETIPETAAPPETAASFHIPGQSGINACKPWQNMIKYGCKIRVLCT